MAWRHIHSDCFNIVSFAVYLAFPFFEEKWTSMNGRQREIAEWPLPITVRLSEAMAKGGVMRKDLGAEIVKEKNPDTFESDQSLSGLAALRRVCRVSPQVKLGDLISNLNFWNSSDDIDLAILKATLHAAVWGIGNCIVTVRRVTDKTSEMTLWIVRKEENHVWGKRILADDSAQEMWRRTCELAREQRWIEDWQLVQGTRKIVESELVGSFASPPDEKTWIRARTEELNQFSNVVFFNAGTGTADDMIGSQAQREWEAIRNEESVRDLTYDEAAELYLSMVNSNNGTANDLAYLEDDDSLALAVSGMNYEASEIKKEEDLFQKLEDMSRKSIRKQRAIIKGEALPRKVDSAIPLEEQQPRIQSRDAEPSFKMPDVSVVRRYYRHYNPSIASEILSALPKAWEYFNANGGTWGPGLIKRFCVAKRETISRHLGALVRSGMTEVNGIKLPHRHK